MNVLLINDDGIFAPGLRALGEAFAATGHAVYVCAPDRERSAASHSATMTMNPITVTAVMPRYSGNPIAGISCTVSL